MKITGYYCYRIFLTIKAHFNQEKFDINKYNFNYLKPPYNVFMKTKGIQFYDYLADKAKTEKQLVDILIASFMDNPNIWVKGVLENYDEYKIKSNKWKAKMNNFPYLFEQDCIKLLNNKMTFNKNLGDFIFNKYCNGVILLETFILFNKIFNFSLDNNINFKYIYQDKYKKYELLLKFDIEKYKNILETSIKNHRK